MKISFITGNKNKFLEVKALLPEVEQLDIDLLEIQSIEPHEIIQHKLSEALKVSPGPVLVEDISLTLDCLNGLPGPLIKWFLKTIGNEGLVGITEKFNNDRAEAKVLYGYATSEAQVQFFEGSLQGRIVRPRGNSDFGFDPIFQPDGHTKTFGEMDASRKNEMSMRRIALEKLKCDIIKA